MTTDTGADRRCPSSTSPPTTATTSSSSTAPPSASTPRADFLDRDRDPRSSRWTGSSAPAIPTTATVLVGVGGIFSKRMTFPGGGVHPVGRRHAGSACEPGWRRRGLLRGIVTKQLHDLHDDRRRGGRDPHRERGGAIRRYGYGLADQPRTSRARPGRAAARGRGRRSRPTRSRREHGAPGRQGAARAGGADHPRLPCAARVLLAGPAVRPPRVSRRRLAPAVRPAPRRLRQLPAQVGLERARSRVHRCVLDEICAATPHAHASLWRYLLTMDLVRTHRLRHALARRPAARPAAGPAGGAGHGMDHVWARIVDLDRAIPLRAYSAAARVRVRDHRRRLPVERRHLGARPRSRPAVPRPGPPGVPRWHWTSPISAPACSVGRRSRGSPRPAGSAGTRPPSRRSTARSPRRCCRGAREFLTPARAGADRARSVVMPDPACWVLCSRPIRRDAAGAPPGARPARRQTGRGAHRRHRRPGGPDPAEPRTPDAADPGGASRPCRASGTRGPVPPAVAGPRGERRRASRGQSGTPPR